MAPGHADRAAAVAAFDLDGTLTDGGSVVRWLSALQGSRRVRAAILRNAGALANGALRSGSAADDAKEALFCDVLGGVELDVARTVSAAFADEHLRHAVRPRVAARLAAHLDAGHVVVVVSASPSMYVARIAEALGAHGTAATELAATDGRLTGRYDGANCRGEEKLRRVDELLEALGATGEGHRPVRYAYGNSRGDLRLLAAADRPVDVSRLGRLGRLGRFPRLDAVALA